MPPLVAACHTLLLAPLVAGACGRIGFDAQAREDAALDARGAVVLDAALSQQDAAPACTLGPWSTPVALTGVNSDDEDWGPALTPDRLTMYFESDRPPDPALWRTNRASVGSSWGPVTRVAVLDAVNVYESNPEISGDGLVLHFTADRVTNGKFDLYRATRLDLLSEFSNEEIVSEITGQVLGPTLSSDQTELIFADGRNNSNFRRTTLADGVWGPTAEIAELNTLSDEGWGSLSGDDLSMIFSTERLDGIDDLFLTTRSSIGAPWSSPSPVQELNLPVLYQN